MTDKELLAVLDLPEFPDGLGNANQFDWLVQNVPDFEYDDDEAGFYYYKKQLIGGIADYAIRLRDEAGQGRFVNGIIEVFEHLYGYSDYKSVMMWLCSEECKPIHYIVAALIAKEKK
jgi:hypothetical protein